MAEFGDRSPQEPKRDIASPKDRGDVLRRLRGIDGAPFDPPLTSRILGNRDINTVVVFSGEAGGGKSTVLGQLDKELQASSVRTYHVFTEDAIAQAEIRLGRHRSEWSNNDYAFMSENLLRLIRRERIRMSAESTDGQRSMLLVETMALPASDFRDRGHSALLGLENDQRESGVFDTFYVGLPPNPAIQERASNIREGAAKVPAAEVVDYLARNNIDITGIEEEDPEVIGEAIKDTLGRQATRPRLRLVQEAVTATADRLASIPGMQERIDAVQIPEGSPEEYKKKAAFLEFILRSVYGVPSERGVVALSPFDPQQHVEWNVTPFLRTREELTQEIYPPTQKEEVLRAARDVLADPEGARAVLAKEALAIAAGITTPDFLEILPGPQLVECLKIMRDTLQADPTAFMEPPTPEDTSSYEGQKRVAFREFFRRAQPMIEDAAIQKRPLLSPQNRKALGMATSGNDIIALANTIEAANNAGLISSDNDLVLVNMFGSYDPFPHNGHLVLARETYNGAGEQGKVPRIVVSTFARNPQKPETEATFPGRLDNLHRGFFEMPNVTVLGIPGDFADAESRRQQIELLAEFDSEGKFRRSCGSDVFETQLQRAKTGDQLSLLLFQASRPLYIIPRRGYDNSRLEELVADARSHYDAEIEVLSEANIEMSGTAIRELPAYRRADLGSRFVRL